MNHPTLYKKSSTGAIQKWDIGVQDNTIVTTWGQVDGALQTTMDVVAEGKNLGKTNATTAAQQAAAETLARWQLKLKKGYVQGIEDARAGLVDDVIEGGVPVMLADRFDKHGDKLDYPCLVQPKLDGHRCIAMVGDNHEVTLWSRTRKPIRSVPHINASLALAFPPGTVLDGELYNHDYRNDFEVLTSLIRASEPREDCTVVQYHVYDVAIPAEPFGSRFGAIFDTLAEFGHPLELVETRLANDEAELLEAFEHFLAEGYEGAMARNADSLYAFGKRSTDLLKLKEFADAEFEVIGVEEGRGKLAGHAIFVCKTSKDAEFRAKLVGATADLKQYFENPALVVGRMLTVKYQGMTKKNGVPRFPVGVRLREDI